MSGKQQSLENKLGSWTDQANFTRAAQESAVDATKVKRKRYNVNRSLMDRVAILAEAHEMSEQAVIGRLLTWALDQAENGELPK